MLELLHAPLQSFPSAPLISQRRFDPAECLENGVIFVLEKLQTPIQLIKMPQDVAEPLIVLGERGLDGVEAPVDLIELAAQKSNKLLIVALGHVAPGEELFSLDWLRKSKSSRSVRDSKR